MTVEMYSGPMREMAEEVIAMRENPPYRYLLVREGECYSLVIQGAGESCLLSDVGRNEGRARTVLALFADGAVPPCTAGEVAEELLARDPSVFT